MPDLHADSCDGCRHVPEPLGTRWAWWKAKRAYNQCIAEVNVIFVDTPRSRRRYRASMEAALAEHIGREEADRG